MPPRRPRTESAHVRVTHLGRQDFIANYWTYEPGDHVSLIGPTHAGKTTLGFQLLGATATPEIPAVVLAMKPQDDTVTKFAARYRFRTVPGWPPAPSIWKPRRPPGWVVWPPHTFDEDVDDEVHERVFGRTIRSCYQTGNKIIFGDEAYSLANELNLSKSLIRIWSKGRSMRCGLWAATQKPTHVPLWMYSAPDHIFLAYDPDKRAQDRYAEIGGVDPDVVKATVFNLPRYHWLYIRRSDRTMCVIGA